MNKEFVIRAASEVAKGLSIYCATCSHYDSVRNGAGECGKVCGSPMGGDCFTNYSGPITEHTRFCFVCGSENPMFCVQSGTKPRYLGICEKHVNLLDRIECLHFSPITIKERDSSKDLKNLFKRSPTVLQQIMAMEKEIAG